MKFFFGCGIFFLLGGKFLWKFQVNIFFGLGLFLSQFFFILDKIEFEKKFFFEIIFMAGGFCFEGGVLPPFFFFFFTYKGMQKFKIIGKPLLGEKYVEGKKERIRKKNNAKFSGHYVRPHTHNVRAHALCLHKHLIPYMI